MPVNAAMWGNPIGEMMFEGMRYFSGAGTRPHPDLHLHQCATDVSYLGLPKPSWDDPFDRGHRVRPLCQAVHAGHSATSTPSFDSPIQLAGSDFGSVSTGTLGTLDVASLTQITSAIEEGISGDFFIGDNAGTISDTSCSAKNRLQFRPDIRGLCPEEPTKQGSYYSAAVAHITAITTTLTPNTDGRAAGHHVRRGPFFTACRASKMPVGDDHHNFCAVSPSRSAVTASISAHEGAISSRPIPLSTFSSRRFRLRTANSGSTTKTWNRARTTTWTPSPSTNTIWWTATAIR